MTILSNHRVHTYKAASVRHRDISPKKVPIQTTSLNKKKTVAAQKMEMLMALLLSAKHIADAAPVRPEPSAPPAEMAFRTITVYGVIYHVDLPVGIDIYEGLRRWYPSLYDAALEEEAEMRAEQYNLTTEMPTEEDIEDAWAHQDYLEWLYD